MFNLRGPYRIGAIFGALSGVLYVLAYLVSGFSIGAMPLALIGVLFLFISYGLTRNIRWLSYIAFFSFFVGVIYLIGFLWSPFIVPTWWVVLVLGANILAVAGMFVALWRSVERPA